MELIFYSFAMGFAGFDFFGIPIIIAALAGKATKKSIFIFAFTTFITSILGGVIISLFVKNSVEFIANFFKNIPDNIWLGLEIFIASLLFFWLLNRIFHKKENEEKEIKKSSWTNFRMFLIGLAFSISAFIDPTFLALSVFAGHNGNIFLIFMAFTIWISISQGTLFAMTGAVFFNKHEKFITWYEKISKKFEIFFKYSLNFAIIVSIILLIIDIFSFIFFGNWFID